MHVGLHGNGQLFLLEFDKYWDISITYSESVGQKRNEVMGG
jgi:hypothetical protein